MKSLLTDKGFAFAVLGAVILTALVFVDKVDPMVLVAWLGGASGPSAGRMGQPKPP